MGDAKVEQELVSRNVLESQAGAWLAVWDLLEELAPGFSQEKGTGKENALAAIRKLSENDQSAPNLGYAWKARLLDGSPLSRDKYGCGCNPALPTFHDGVIPREFFGAFGIELAVRMAEDEMDGEAYEAMTEHGFVEGGENYKAWNPEKPSGDGWCLIAIFDTEDGPACWWVREKSAV